MLISISCRCFLWNVRRYLGFDCRNHLRILSIPSLGQGARSDVETVSSRPLLCWMCAYQGLTSNSRTSLHSGSPLFHTWRRSKTGPSVRSHVCIAVPEVARHWKRNIHSCGVSLLAVHRIDRIEWRASRSTSCHLSSGHPR